MIKVDPRRNLVDRVGEDFKPPVFKPNTTRRNRFENFARRFLDLQAGSGWHDMRRELATARGKLIDIGCGAQVYRDLVPQSVAYRGIDTLDAKDRFGYSVPDTHYFSGDDWGVEDAAFDVALCTEVLEHIETPLPFLEKIRNCLCPGGRLIMTVPFAARWHFIPFDYWRYTPSGLKSMLVAAGFEDVRICARGNPLTVACYKLMALNLMLLFGPPNDRRRWIKFVGGLVGLPILALCAVVANLTLHWDWGDDCLGYTVTATRTI